MAIHAAGAQRMGFFTDTTVCIGCKACEVACKQWNDLPADGSRFEQGSSYDHTAALSASTWRHVRFAEIGGDLPAIPAAGAGDLDLVALATTRVSGGVDVAAAVAAMDEVVFMSDVCKHCTNAGCMDACPTGALIRTEFETVVLQADVCNGCGYCIPACPFGVVDRSPDDGRAAKCTLCYDRLQDGLEPACAKACPTDSIQFGVYDELVDVAQRRVATLQDRGLAGAYLYGAGDAPGEEIAGGLGAFFLLTEPPERYGLPAEADSPIQENVVPATFAAVGAGLLAAAGGAGGVGPKTPRGGGGGGVRPQAAEGRAARAGQGEALARGSLMSPERADIHSPTGPAEGHPDTRDTTPALGTRGEPGRWQRAVEGARVALHKRGFADGRWSFLYSYRSSYAAEEADIDAVVAAAERARTGPVPEQIQGPLMNPAVWTWEVPLYFWFGGIAAGSSFVALACDLSGDHRSARIARRVSLAALVPSPPLLILDLGRPERFV